MQRLFRLLLVSIFLCLSYTHTASAQSRAATKYACPMHADVTASKPGNCPRCKMALAAVTISRAPSKRRKSARALRRTVTASRKPQSPPVAPSPPGNWANLSPAERLKELERLAPTLDYTCPMHPDIHQAQAGLCPKCGMNLVSLNPSVRGKYDLKLSATPRKPKVGEPVHLRFSIFNPETGTPVKRFVINHEKLFHLFVISQDMTDYQHIHPQLEPDGSFIIKTTLQRSGLYKLHTDFFPVDGTPQVIPLELETAGSKGHGQTMDSQARLVPDTTLAKTIEGMNVSLMFGNKAESSSPVVGDFLRLKYRLTDAQTGEPIRDLEPYLGAWGHTLILNADQSTYLHSHPTEMVSGGVEARGGPEVEFGVMFPEAGNYRIWTQFQRGGKIITVPFTIDVLPASSALKQ